LSQVILKVISFSGQPLQNGDSKIFDERGGTIGRSASCDWTLPDPEHFLSSRHAALIVEDGRFLLIDTSTNGVFINHSREPVGADRAVPLNDGDLITVGDYELAVSLADDMPLVAAAAPLAAARVRAPADIPDPLDLLADTIPPNTNRRDEAPAFTPPPAAAAARPARGFDERYAAPRTEYDTVDPLALLDGGPTPTASRFDSALPSERDDVPFVSGAFQPPRASAEVIPEDWDDLDLMSPVTEMPTPPPPPAPAPRKPAPVRPAAAPVASDEPPPVPRPRRSERDKPRAAAASPPAPVEAAPPSPLEATNAATAFLRGAGLDPSLASGIDPVKTLELAGALFALSMEGLREVLMARTSLKSGFRMDVTYVAPVDNNPLKFAAGGVDEIIEKLLFRRSKGYLAPKESIEEAFQDVKDHQVGMVAGLRAGFDEMLRQFDPAQLEKRFEANARRGLLSNRKAQNWESYCEWYAELAKAVDEAYEKLFGEAFADAYQEQTRRNAGLQKK